MKLTTIALVLVGLFAIQRWAQARDTVDRMHEATPTDPYSGVTNVWETLSGQNFNAAGSNPNAHPALIDYTSGQPCHCPGSVGVQ